MIQHESEYQRKFQHDPTSATHYKEMLKLRRQRRSINHYHTPITWPENLHEHSDKENESSKTKRNEIIEGNGGKQSTPIEKSVRSTSCILKSPFKDNYTQTNGLVDKRDIGVQSPSKIIEKRSIGIQSPDRSERRRSKRLYLANCKNMSDENTKVKKRKLIKMPSTSKSSKSTVIQKAPIIAYGWADKSSIEKKKTYNVRAPSSQVKKTALQAANMREVNKKSKKDRKKRLEEEKLEREALINSITNFNQWQTEYQKQFCH